MHPPPCRRAPQAWKLSQYKACVFLDADTLVLKNVDAIFSDYAECIFAAAPDVGWPDCFNSGVFYFKPSQSTYSGLCKMAATEGSFDGVCGEAGGGPLQPRALHSSHTLSSPTHPSGGDQGLLNQYFSSWARGTQGVGRLPFTYNMTANARCVLGPMVVLFVCSFFLAAFFGLFPAPHARPPRSATAMPRRTSASRASCTWSTLSARTSPGTACLPPVRGGVTAQAGHASAPQQPDPPGPSACNRRAPRGAVSDRKVVELPPRLRELLQRLCPLQNPCGEASPWAVLGKRRFAALPLSSAHSPLGAACFVGAQAAKPERVARRPARAGRLSQASRLPQAAGEPRHGLSPVPRRLGGEVGGG